MTFFNIILKAFYEIYNTVYGASGNLGTLVITYWQRRKYKNILLNTSVDEGLGIFGDDVSGIDSGIPLAAGVGGGVITAKISQELRELYKKLLIVWR